MASKIGGEEERDSENSREQVRGRKCVAVRAWSEWCRRRVGEPGGFPRGEAVQAIRRRGGGGGAAE